MATPLNFVWEMLQAPAFTPDDWLIATGWCALATVGDVILVILLWAFFTVVFRGPYWFAPARAMRYVALITLGVVVQAILEWVPTRLLGLWGYAPGHPAILGVGLLPLLQPVILLPATFVILARWSEAR